MTTQQATQDPSLWENSVVEGLSKKIQAISDDLDSFQTGLESLTLEERNTKLEGIESAILECSNDLADLEVDGNIFIDKRELENLRSKIESLMLSKEDLKKQIESQSRLEMESLSQSVVDSEESPAVLTDKTWLGRQREGLTSKQEWKENTGANVLRALGGVGLVGGSVWLFNRLFGGKKNETTPTSSVESGKSRRELRRERREQRRKERTERRANRPWWQKFLIGGAVAGGTVVGGVQVYKHWNQIKSRVKEKLGLALSFEEAMYTVETEVRNGINKDTNFGNMCAHFEGMSYDENTEEVRSFGESVKINKKNKTIVGMDDVHFASWEELFHAVNIVNFAKRNLKGLGNNETPFIINQTTGDIDFSFSEGGKAKFISANGSNFWTEVLGLGGAGIGSILGLYFLGLKGGLIGGVGAGLAGYTVGSLIDNTSSMGHMCSTISKGANLKKFVKYLNEQNIRGEQEEVYEPDDTTPLHKYLNEIKREIDDGYTSGGDFSAIRDLKIEWDESNPSQYKIVSYYQEAILNLEGCTAKKGEEIDISKISKISIGKYNKIGSDSDTLEESWGDGLNIDFPKSEEGLKEAIRTVNLTNKIRYDWKSKCDSKYPFDYGRYKMPFSFEVDALGWGTNHMGGTTILNQDTLKQKYPTIYQDLREFPTVASLGGENFQRKMHDQAINDESTGSQYIKFLHQMGKGKYWKKI